MTSLYESLGLVLTLAFFSTSAHALDRQAPTAKETSTNASSKDWSIVDSGGDQGFSARMGKLEIPLRVETGRPKISKWEQSPKQPKIWLLTYVSGTSGTSALYRVERVAVIDVRHGGRLLGDYPFRYEPLFGAKPLTQPEWLFNERDITVTDKEFGEGGRIRW